MPELEPYSTTAACEHACPACHAPAGHECQPGVVCHARVVLSEREPHPLDPVIEDLQRASKLLLDERAVSASVCPKERMALGTLCDHVATLAAFVRSSTPDR